MFSDNKRNKTMSETSSGQPNRIEKSTKIKGDIESDADFRIDGRLEGTIKTTGKVIIGKEGKIIGKVECTNADIEGNFSGELYVSQLLALKSTAIIDGDVTVSKLAVEPGATFNAACNMQGKAGFAKKAPKHNDAKEIAQAKS
ncbi:MAG: polymer-forming cytoskeletal protein [Flavobacteriaceae bacterium]|nr:polymer-forming cytoskeletal protein [Flavobacteriaceae bacterium]